MNSSIDTTSTTRVLRFRKVQAVAVLLAVSLMVPALSSRQPSGDASNIRAVNSSVSMRLKGGGFGYSRQLLPSALVVFSNLKDSVSQEKSSNSVGVEKLLCAAGETQSTPTGTPLASAISGVTLGPGKTPP